MNQVAQIMLNICERFKIFPINEAFINELSSIGLLRTSVLPVHEKFPFNC